MIYNRILKQDYDEHYKIGKNEKFLCYSKKQLERLYPNSEDYKIVGETVKANKKEKIAELLVKENETYIVSAYGEHNNVLFKTAGYVCVGENKYVALLQSRLAFLLILLLLLVAIVVAVVLIVGLLMRSTPAFEPDHPLPDPDPYVEEIEKDDTDKVESEGGGGSVSMIYTLAADLSLSSGNINIYFMNPNASNHDVVVQLCIVSEDKEVKIAESGLVQAGYGLYKLDMIEDTAVLSEGVYNAVYKVLYYDPLTGEKALVESTITDVALTVTN